MCSFETWICTQVFCERNKLGFVQDGFNASNLKRCKLEIIQEELEFTIQIKNSQFHPTDGYVSRMSYAALHG